MTHVTHLTKTVFALAIGALLFTGAYAASQAQETGQAPQEDQAAMQNMEECPMMGGMMGEGMQQMNMQQMHEQMMERPRMRSALQVHLLPVLKDSLSLTEEQAARLEEQKSQLLKKQKTLQKREKELQEQLQKTLNAEEPDLGKAESLLSEQKKAEAEKEMALYRTAAQMKAELSDEQRSRFTDLSPQELHQAAMTHLSMQDMMRM